MRANWLSNRIFKSFDDIVDHCCYAWNTLIDQPWKTCPSPAAIGQSPSLIVRGGISQSTNSCSIEICLIDVAASQLHLR
jgi:hypothetical protein